MYLTIHFKNHNAKQWAPNQELLFIKSKVLKNSQHKRKTFNNKYCSFQTITKLND